MPSSRATTGSEAAAPAISEAITATTPGRGSSCAEGVGVCERSFVEKRRRIFHSAGRQITGLSSISFFVALGAVSDTADSLGKPTTHGAFREDLKNVCNHTQAVINRIRGWGLNH